MAYSRTHYGTGYYIGDHLILTAGHVIYTFNDADPVDERDMENLSEGYTHPTGSGFEQYALESAFQIYDYVGTYLTEAKNTTRYGSTSLPDPTSPFPNIGAQIASTAVVASADSQFVHGELLVGANDAGVVVFLNSSDAFSPEMGLAATNDQTKLSMEITGPMTGPQMAPSVGLSVRKRACQKLFGTHAARAPEIKNPSSRSCHRLARSM